MTWKVYLSGEIHTDWRQQIIQGAAAQSPQQVVELLKYIVAEA
ncbi:YtoQ family protein [Pseudomonas sp. LPB0260]|nr:YtoQ family protein [Pseudomonas sp. LPB0260]